MQTSSSLLQPKLQKLLPKPMKTTTSSIFIQSILCSYNLDCSWLQTLYLQLLEFGSILRTSNTFISRLNHINYTHLISSKTEGENLIATICCTLVLKLVTFTVLHSTPTFWRAIYRINNAALISRHFACIKTNDTFFTPSIHFKNTIIIWRNDRRHTNDLELYCSIHR